VWRSSSSIISPPSPSVLITFHTSGQLDHLTTITIPFDHLSYFWPLQLKLTLPHWWLPPPCQQYK
jgi:hypothetical protein